MSALPTPSLASNAAGIPLRSAPITLLEAFEVLKRPLGAAAPRRETSLLCGFTPLHLKTFLAAHLRTFFPASSIEIKTGLYGDLAGNLERLASAGCSEACLVAAWSDS